MADTFAEAFSPGMGGNVHELDSRRLFAIPDGEFDRRSPIDRPNDGVELCTRTLPGLGVQDYPIAVYRGGDLLADP